MKYCSKCKKRQPTSNFHASVNNPDGLHYNCKICNKLYAYAWIKKLKMVNPDRLREIWRERQRRYRAKHPGKNQIFNLRHQKTWRDKHVDINRLRAKLGMRTTKMYEDITTLSRERL